MSAIIYYMVHGAEANSTQFLLSHWERYKLPLIIVSPEKDPVRQHTHDAINVGEMGTLGEPMYQRIIAILRHFYHSTKDFAMIVEYDCVCLLDDIPFRSGLFGTPQFRPPDHALQFMSERYVTPPYMLDSKSAQRMLRKADEYHYLTEGGYADRLLAALAFLSGVPIMGFFEGSWSKLMPNPKVLSQEMRHELSQAKQRGCKWFHFIKTREQFDFVLRP